MLGTASPLVVKSLIATVQREVTPKNMFPILDAMNSVVEEVYNAVFQGPLPAVDGNALTNLNAGALTGTFPPGMGVALLDDLNLFTRGQSIVWNDEDEPFLVMGFGDGFTASAPTSFFRLMSITDGEFHISQNAFYDSSGPNWDQDDAALDSLILDFVDGELNFRWWDNGLGDFRNTFLFSGPDLYVGNEADDDYLYLFLRDANDVIHLGESAATDNTGVGWVAITAKPSTQLPSANANHSGIIGINTTSNRFIFYIGANRYYVTGTSF